MNSGHVTQWSVLRGRKPYRIQEGKLKLQLRTSLKAFHIPLVAGEGISKDAEVCPLQKSFELLKKWRKTKLEYTNHI